MAKLSKRQFLAEVLDDDPGELLKWHQERSWPEQQRFVQVLDGLYGAYAKKDKRKAAPRKARSAGGSRQGDSPRSVASAPSLRSCASAPQLSSKGLKPIDVFEKKRRADAQLMATFGPHFDLHGANTLEKWLDTRTATPASVSTAWTECSQMTRTSQGTTYSAPCTKYTQDYRKHARAFAVNRRSWSVPNAHVPEAELVTDGLPEERRLTTSYGRTFGTVPKGHSLRKETLDEVFKPGAKHLLESYLNTCTPLEKERLCQVGRSMVTFKNDRHFSTSTARAYNLNKNKQFYQPSTAARTVGDPYKSSIPMGSVGADPNAPPPKYPDPEPIPEVNFPP